MLHQEMSLCDQQVNLYTVITLRQAVFSGLRKPHQVVELYVCY